MDIVEEILCNLDAMKERALRDDYLYCSEYCVLEAVKEMVEETIEKH